MKKILFYLCLIFLFVGCSKEEINDVSVYDIIYNIEKKYPNEDAIKEDLLNQDVAERFGISPSDIEEGVVYHTNKGNSADEIIIVKAKDKSEIEGIERGISAEIVGIGDSWKGNEKEAKKIDNHIFKTIGTYVILCVSDDAEDIVKIFDDALKK